MIPNRNEVLNMLGNMFFVDSTREDYRRLLEQTAIKVCDDMFENVSNYWFTDHGPKHSDSVLYYAIELANYAQRYVKKFNEVEIFGLASACYLHDIGMSHIPQEFTLEEAGYSKELIQKIREWHVEAVDELLPRKRDRLSSIYAQFDLLENALPLVCRAHGSREHKKACDEFISRRNEFLDFRGDLLGKILLIADELNLDHRRAYIDHPHAEHFPLEAKAHQYKQYYVRDVELNGPQVQIVYSFPSEMREADRDVYMQWNSAKLIQQISLVQREQSLDVRSIFDLTIVPPISTSVQGKKIAPAEVSKKAEKLAGKGKRQKVRERLRDCPNLFDPNRAKPKEEGALSPAINDLMDDLFRALDTELAKKFFHDLYVKLSQNETAKDKLLEAVRDFERRVRSQYRTTIEPVPLQPFLITGRTGCGKSALIHSILNTKGNLLGTKLPTRKSGGRLVVLVDCRRFRKFDEIIEQLLLKLAGECRRSKSIIWPSLQEAQWADRLTEESISTMDIDNRLSTLRGTLNHLHKKPSIGFLHAVPVIFILDNMDRIPSLELRRTIVEFCLREGTSGYPFFVIPLRNTTKNMIDKSYDDFDKIATHAIRSPSHQELLATRLSAAFSQGLLADIKSWSRKQRVAATLNKCNLEFDDLRRVCWEVMTSLVEGKFVTEMSGTNMRNALTIFRAIMKALPMHLVLIFKGGHDRQTRTHELIRILALEGHPCYFESRSKIRNVFSSIYGYSIFTQMCLYTILQHLTAIPDQYTSLDTWIARAMEIGLPKQEVEKQVMEMIRSHFAFVEVEGYEDGIPEEYRFVDVLAGNRIRLSCAGEYHFSWLAYDVTYLDCVMQDTWMDVSVARQLARLRRQTPLKLSGAFERVDIFLDYLEREEKIERAAWHSALRIPEFVQKIRDRINAQRKALLK